MLYELFGSKCRAKIIGWLFAHPQERYFVRQLTALVRDDATNLSRELARLEALGLLLSQREGRQKYYQANSQSPVYPELHGLALKTAGLADVLRRAFSPLQKKISLAFIYGSLANGETGPASDVDLMVVGTADEMALHRAVSQAEKEIRRPVNYTALLPAEWKKRKGEKGGFISRIWRGPKILITGDADGL